MEALLKQYTPQRLQNANKPKIEDKMNTDKGPHQEEEIKHATDVLQMTTSSENAQSQMRR